MQEYNDHDNIWGTPFCVRWDDGTVSCYKSNNTRYIAMKIVSGVICDDETDNLVYYRDLKTMTKWKRKDGKYVPACKWKIDRTQQDVLMSSVMAGPFIDDAALRYHTQD